MIAATPLGAYGLRFSGLAPACGLLPAAESHWPKWELRRRVGVAHAQESFVTPSWAVAALRGGGVVQLHRSRGSATFVTPQPLGDELLVHPYLAPVAAVASRWHGRESFHAGCVAGHGGAWGVIGDRASGKSSTLAWLAQQGSAILTDDLLVVDDGSALAGPRALDLRRDAAELLGVETAVDEPGARERLRLRLGAVPSRLRLRGWLVLAWGETAGAEPVPTSERLRVLTGARAVRVPPLDAAVLLELAALPMFTVRRPQTLASLADTAERILELAC